MVKQAYCSVCGKPVPLQGLKRSYCSDACARVGKLEQQKRWRFTHTRWGGTKKGADSCEPAPTIIKLNAVEMIAKAAHDSGMTYGEYVARMDGMK